MHLNITPEVYLAHLEAYAECLSENYEMEEMDYDANGDVVCYVNHKEERAFRVILTLDDDTGKVDYACMMQMTGNTPEGDLLALYTVAIAMGEPDPDNLEALYTRVDAAMTSRETKGNAVEEVYKLEGYYICIRCATYIDGDRYLVEVFREFEY